MTPVQMQEQAEAIAQALDEADHFRDISDQALKQVRAFHDMVEAGRKRLLDCMGPRTDRRVFVLASGKVLTAEWSDSKAPGFPPTVSVRIDSPAGRGE